MTRLDDLLGYDDGLADRRGRRFSVRFVLVPIVILFFTTCVWALLRALDVGVPYLLILAVAIALAVIQQAIRTLEIRRIPPTLRDNPPIDDQQPHAPDGVRITVRGWNQRLEYAQDDARHFDRLIKPAMREIIDERVRLTHGVTSENDPEAYREILGPTLMKFLSEPAPRRVTPHMIAALVAEMEAL
ncbi:MAG TPA: hypothetical protein VGJ28_18945 [Micromonosporaceae bacterium]